MAGDGDGKAGLGRRPIKEQVWCFISKNQPGLQTFRSTQELSWQPFSVS